MRGPDTSKHYVTNMAADEEAAIATVIAAIFLVNKEEEENRETVLDLPNVLAVLYTKERRHIPGITGYACCLRQSFAKLPFSCTKHHWKKPRTFGTMKLEAMFHCVQKCNLIFSPVETYLNPQRSSRRPPSWIFIRNILFILPLGAEWMEWRSVHSGIGMRNRKTRAFYILTILIPELWIKKRALSDCFGMVCQYWYLAVFSLLNNKFLGVFVRM